MKFKGRLELEQGLKQISVVPFINIMLLLLMFLTLGSGFVLQAGVRVNLPRIFANSPGLSFDL